MAKLIRRYRTVDGAKVFKGYFARWYDRDRVPPQKELSLRTKDEQQARIKLAQLELREIAGEWDPWKDRAPREGVPLQRAVDLYLAERNRDAKSGELAPKTARADAGVLERFAKSAPIGMAVAFTQPEHIEAFLNACSLSVSSHNTYVVRLSGFFAWCQKRGLIRDNPASDVRRKKQGRKDAAFPYLTRAQFDRLITTIQHEGERGGIKSGEISWMIDVCRFLVSTGLRPGEMAQMKWNWISDLHGPAPFIHVQVRPDFIPKWRKERSVPLSGDAIEIVRRLYATSESDYVFTGTRGRKGDTEHLNIEYVSRRFRHFRKMAKLPETIHLHSLRHTFAYWLVIAGVDLYRVQRLLGHRSIETTMRYAHLAPHDLRGEVERVFGGSDIGPTQKGEESDHLRKAVPGLLRNRSEIPEQN